MTGIAGGKGTPRRKQVKKSGAAAAGDDRKLQAALKKMNVQPVTGVEEVNMFKEDGNVLHFGRPQGELVDRIMSLDGAGREQRFGLDG